MFSIRRIIFVAATVIRHQSLIFHFLYLIFYVLLLSPVLMLPAENQDLFFHGQINLVKIIQMFSINITIFIYTRDILQFTLSVTLYLASFIRNIVFIFYFSFRSSCTYSLFPCITPTTVVTIAIPAEIPLKST